jgi:hypothetical protein
MKTAGLPQGNPAFLLFFLHMYVLPRHRAANPQLVFRRKSTGQIFRKGVKKAPR